MGTKLLVAIIVTSIFGFFLVAAAIFALLWYRNRGLFKKQKPVKVVDDVREAAPSAGVVKLPKPAYGTQA